MLGLTNHVILEDNMDLTVHWVGFTSIGIFVVAYLLVMAEEYTHLRKSKPVILAAGLIWAIVAYEYSFTDNPQRVEIAVRHFLVEFAELFLFLLTAIRAEWDTLLFFFGVIMCVGAWIYRLIG